MVDHRRFITVEGSEGTGKSTLLNSIEKQLSQAQQAFIMTREPGGTPVAESIRKIILGDWPEEPIANEVELLLMFASRKQHVDRLIMPQLMQGQWVVSDRFFDASYAYQGFGRGLDLAMLDRIKTWLLGDFKPGLTLLLDCPVDVALSRIAHRGKDRIEVERVDFFERVRQGYLQLAEREPERFQIIDVNAPLDVVTKRLQVVVEAYIQSVLAS